VRHRKGAHAKAVVAEAAIVRRSNLNTDDPHPVHPFFKTSEGGLGRREEQVNFTLGEFL
jgi:hypothetical protein